MDKPETAGSILREYVTDWRAWALWAAVAVVWVGTLVAMVEAADARPRCSIGGSIFC